MRISGLEFALPNLTTLTQVSPEAIIASAPDIILFAGKREDLDQLIARPGWRDTPAVKAHRVWVVSREEWLIPGPRTVDGIEQLATRLREHGGY